MCKLTHFFCEVNDSCINSYLHSLILSISPSLYSVYLVRPARLADVKSNNPVSLFIKFTLFFKNYGSVTQFSCKQSIHKDLWDVKGNRAKGKSKESRDINLALDNIKQMVKAKTGRAMQEKERERKTKSGKMKSLERKNEDLRDEIAIRDETIEQLQSNIKQMEVEHSRAMMNKDNEHRKALEAKEAEHKEETNILNSIINTAHRWYPDFANLLRLERLAKQIGLSAMEFAELIKGRIVNFTGRLFSSEHNRWFATDNTPLQILRDNDKRLTLTANRIPLSQWFSEQYGKLRPSIRQPLQPKKSRGMKL